LTETLPAGFSGGFTRPSFWRAYPPMFVADLPADGWDKRKIYLPPIFGGIPKFARRMWAHKFIVLYSRFLKST